MGNFYPGQPVTLTCSFLVGITPTDPTTVSLKVMAPDGTTTEYTYAGGTITKSGTGVYTKSVVLTTEGTWWYRWASTGTAQASTEGYIECVRSPFV